VLFEMLTGKPLFEGETISDTLAAVLKTEPDLAQVPAQARKLVRRCLEKDPKHRLRDSGDAKLLLEESPAEMAPVKRSGRWWKIAAVLALAIGAIDGWEMARFRQPPADQRVLRFQIEPPEGGEFSYGPPPPASLSHPTAEPPLMSLRVTERVVCGCGRSMRQPPG
jgi:eukaryotic-like serine/threonine-protein kinase